MLVFMPVNYALNFAVIGLPAVRFASVPIATVAANSLRFRFGCFTVLQIRSRLSPKPRSWFGRWEAAGGHPRFDSLAGRDHCILDVYDQRNVYQWLLQQKRGASAAHPLPKT